MTNEIEETLSEFTAGYHTGFKNPGEILPKERSWFWCGHFHGQTDGMTSEFAHSQGTEISLPGPEEIFMSEYVE